MKKIFGVNFIILMCQSSFLPPRKKHGISVTKMVDIMMYLVRTGGYTSPRSFSAELLHAKVGG